MKFFHVDSQDLDKDNLQMSCWIWKPISLKRAIKSNKFAQIFMTKKGQFHRT